MIISAALAATFLEAHLHCTNTFFGVARPVGTGKTITAERINPFPTAIDLSSGKTDTYCNKVAPTARIYLHLICRKRHLPLKLRKGKTIGCGAKRSSALVLRETLWFLPMSRTGLPQNSATHLCYAKRHGLFQCLEPGNRNIRIRSCVNSPLKK